MGLRKIKIKERIKIRKIKKIKKNFIETLKLIFWYKKLEKCKMKIKKINPTPKSIIHRNPINISQSSIIKIIPEDIRKIPAKYHKVIILIDKLKKNNVKVVKICNIKISFNKFYTKKLSKFIPN